MDITQIAGIVNLVLTILTLVMLLFVVISALFGLRRSWKFSLIKLGRTVTAILLSFIAVKIIASSVPMSDLLAPIMGDFAEDLSQTSPTLVALINNLPLAILAPLAFVLLFFVFNALLMIPAIFVKKIVLKNEYKAKAEAKKAKRELRSLKKGNAERSEELRRTIKAGKTPWSSRGISAGIKAVNAVIFIALLFMPISCLLTTVGDGMITLKDAMAESGASLGGDGSDPAVGGEELSVICDEIVSPIVSNPVIAVSANPVYRAMYRNMTRVTVGDVTCYLDKELSDIFELVGGATYLLVDIEDYGEPQKNAINTVVGYVADSEFRSTIAAELFSAVGSAWQNGEDFLGIENPSSGDIAIVFDPLIEILAESDAESVEKDLHTFANIIGVFIDHEMLSAVTDTLESEDPLEGVRNIISAEFLADVLTEIYANEDFKTMSQPVVRFTFNTLLAAIGSDPMAPAENDEAPDLEGDEIKAEAEAIYALIDSALDFVDSMPENTNDMGGLDIITEIDVGALGRFYDESQHSQILRDGFHDVFVALLSSDMFDDMRTVCDIIIDHINNDPDLSMSNLLSAVQELASLFIQYEGSTVATDTVKISATISSLIEKIDTHTAEIINEMLDANAFDMDLLGESNEASSQASKLLTTIVDLMASEEMKGLSEEEIQNEAKAIDYMLKIVNAASSSEGGSSISSVFEAEEDNAEEMMETMLNSRLSTGAINAIAYDDDGNLTQEAKDMSENVTEEDRESVVASAENYYKNNAGDMTEEEKETLQSNMNAIAAIFGSDLSGNFSDWDAALQ